MRPYSHLSEDERDEIGVLRAAGRSMGAIARALGRAKATISREVQRNALPFRRVLAASRRRSLSIAQAA
jgi:transposase, IS30 family